jgi:excisionase family DNA binding protein
MSDEVLPFKELAAGRKLAEKTVYAMAAAGEIPAFKIRGQWRIERSELDPWTDAQPRGGFVDGSQGEPCERGRRDGDA